MRRTANLHRAVAAFACVLLAPIFVRAQTSGTPPSEAARMADIEHRLAETQKTIEDSLREIQRLRAELATLHPATSSSMPAKDDVSAAMPAATSSSAEVMREQVDTLQAEVKQHEQMKVETASKYPVRVSGLALFNAFSNAGVVDNAEVPTLALFRNPGASHGSLGATVRQTLLQLDASGPRLGNGRTSAAVSIDFSGGAASNLFGYQSYSGFVRMREIKVNIDWSRTTIEAGYFGPLISPLSPTSYAMVATSALSASGNLWTWSPQLRVEHRIPLSDTHRIALEGGLISPQTPGYASIQLDSPSEASRRPGYEGRVSYIADAPTPGTRKPFSIGLSGYSSAQSYGSASHVHAWAVTGDWQIPITPRVELTGEAYRGRALGSLGGGLYKDVLMGTDRITGLARTTGVDAVGGWGQAKVRFTSTLETNAFFGLDDALASNFNNLLLPTDASPLQYYLRNRSIVANIIYRPKTYLIFSAEYRRLQSWRYTGPSNLANIFTLTAGYQF